MKKLLTTLLAVCLVFTNAGFFSEMLSYADTTYITKAEFSVENAQKDIILSTDPDNVQTCSYTDLVFSPLLKLYAENYEGMYVKAYHYDYESENWVTHNALKKKIQKQKDGKTYAQISFVMRDVKKFVAVGSKHSLKVEILKDAKSATALATYYFDLIRSVELDTLTATDGNGQALVVTKQTDAKQYIISCTDNTLKLTCTAKTPEYAKITVDDAEVKSGAETTVDLTKCRENDARQKVIPIAVEYTGAEGTGEGTKYTIVVDKQDYTPQVTTKYVGATPENKDIGFAETKKYISCSKDTEIKMEAEARAPEGSVLSYQWYIQPVEGGSVAKKIDNATESSYTIPTQHSARNIYYCEVTNTVSGIALTARTEKCCIEVKPTYASPAEILSQTESAEVFFEQAGYRIKIQAKTPDRGGILKYQWYQTSQAETTGGKLVASEENYVTVDTSTVGESYYYCKVSNLLEKEDGRFSESQPTVSRPIRVNVVGAEQYFEGIGTKAEPFLIKSADELKKIREIVAKGNSFANVYFKMQPTNEERSITLPTDWQPIGSLKSGFTDTSLGVGVFPFSGNLDGNGCKLIIQENGAPLFRYVREASVSNLQIFGSRINGAGLVDEYFIDYGEDGNYASGVPDTVTIDHVTLLSGSSTKYSGFIHGNASGKNNIYITNSVVERNVIIGYDRKESQIGSFAGCLNGSIISCKSAAKVYGVSQVGGIAGEKGQSMGACSVLNCQFTGEVHATGNYAGGILGSGYDGKGTAPNTPVVTIRNCVVRGSVEGKSNVGGILGGEPGCEDCWGNGAGSVVDNLFCGTVKGEDENAVVGAIVGFLKSYNENQSVASNYFIDTCGAKNGIGAVEIQHDTNFDISKTGSCVSDADVKSDTMLDRLNASSSSYKNWVKGEDGYPDHSKAPVLYAIELSGNYKTMYNTGDAFSTANMVITGKLSDGTTQNIPLSDKELKFSGFDSNKRAVQTITVTYGVAKTTYDVTVLYKESQIKEIVAYFTLLGDSYHKEATANDGPHTLSKGNLQTWVSQTTVYDVFKKVLNDNGITWKESSKLGTVYIESLTRNGVTLGEFDNGNLSGWMYTLNGTHPDLGVAQQFLEKGDRIVFHYTDDYTKEEGSDHWNTPGGGVVEEVKNVTTDTKTGTTTAPTEVKVSEKTNADGTKTKVAEVKVSTDNQKEILKQAKASKSKEIILNVSSKSVGDAAKADVTLEKSFIDSIVRDTDAKLTIKTPFGDKTYTQEELKAMSAAATGSTVTVAIEKAAEEPTDDNANIAKAKSIIKDMKLIARSSKTTKKNIKAVLKSDAKVNASIKELKELGFTVKYRFYRSTKKAASYKSTVTKKTATYTNTSGKKGTKYFYKVQARVYDENGKLIAKTALKQCKYASRTWTKAK